MTSHTVHWFLLGSLACLAPQISSAQQKAKPEFLKQTFQHDYKEALLSEILSDLHISLKINSMVDGVSTRKATLEVAGTASDRKSVV